MLLWDLVRCEDDSIQPTLADVMEALSKDGMALITVKDDYIDSIRDYTRPKLVTTEALAHIRQGMVQKNNEGYARVMYMLVGLASHGKSVYSMILCTC
jgi:hypothetical protein